jgi:hypothetical protein
MRILYTILLLSCVMAAQAQSDKWVGTWRMVHQPWPHIPPIIMELQVGTPENGTLYPAQVTIKSKVFTGIYEVLLAEKNEHQLGIGRGKFPIQETPFKLGAWMLYLNGTLDYNKNQLSLKRMWINSFGLFMRGLYDDDEIYEQPKVDIRDFIYNDSIGFRKINSTPWEHPHTHRILHPENDSIYYGIYDKIIVSDSVIHVLIRDDDAIDKDTVSLLHNGKLILNREFISEKERDIALPLDTGMNILTFFADNYGRLPPNTGSFRVQRDSGQYLFTFANKENAFATFLVGQFYRVPKDPNVRVPVVHIDPRVQERKKTLVEEFTFDTPQLELSLWDDAAEDGDSVSIRLNNKIVVSGFPVLKQRQNLSVTLTPGMNMLLLIADNLGSIPPNTAVMRITAGKIVKYVRIKTDLKQNNLILINYQPPKN